MKNVFKAVCAGIAMVAISACGSDTGSTQTAANTASASATSTNGSTVASVAVSTPDGSSTVTIPQGTTLYSDAAKTQAVSGSLTVTTTTILSASALPAAAQAGTLVGVANTVFDKIGAVADVTITNGSSTAKAFGSPITVNLKLPAGYATVGSSLDYYSFDSTGAWTKEGTATVKADNSIDMSVSHLSGWGVATFKNSTPAASVAGTYSGTVVGHTNTFTLIIDSNGAISGSDNQGATITGTANTQTGAFTATVAATAANGNTPVNLVGTINLATGAMSGSLSFTPPGSSTVTGTFTGIRK